MPYWVGLDMGHERTSLCIIDKTGAIVTEQNCAADENVIIERLKSVQRRTIRQIGMEAGVGTHIARRLRADGYPVRVLDVGRARRFLQINRLKTDASDARGLAELVRVGQSIGSEVHVKRIETQNIRTMLVIRQQLIQQRRKLDQLIQALIRLHGGEAKRSKAAGHMVACANRAASRMEADGLSMKQDIRPLLAVAEGLRAHQADLDQRIAEMVASHPVCQLLMSVPGIGPITALSFYSSIDDPDRFRRVSDVGAYLGLTPLIYQSGSSLRRGGISKAGCKMTRTYLVSAATVIICRCRTESPLRTWALSLRERTGTGKARVALARKLAVLLLHLWKTGERFDPDRLTPRPV